MLSRSMDPVRGQLDGHGQIRVDYWIHYTRLISANVFNLHFIVFKHGAFFVSITDLFVCIIGLFVCIIGLFVLDYLINDTRCICGVSTVYQRCISVENFIRDGISTFSGKIEYTVDTPLIHC